MKHVLEQLRVMVVDADPVFQRLAEASLALVGFSAVAMAKSVEAALPTLMAEEHQLAFLDWDGSPEEASDFFTYARFNDRLKATALIAMTQSVSPRTRLAAIAAGADGVLVKPFSRRTVEHVIVSALNGDVARRAKIVMLPECFSADGFRSDLGAEARTSRQAFDAAVAALQRLAASRL